jgi:hypothetical protein
MTLAALVLEETAIQRSVPARLTIGRSASGMARASGNIT